MINKDRIVPITRTDLLSFFAAVVNCMNIPDVLAIEEPEDGAIDLAQLSGRTIAAEPVKALRGTPANASALYCCLDYDFQNPMTPANNNEAFVANPGDIYMIAAGDGAIMAMELGSGRTFTVGSID